MFRKLLEPIQVGEMTLKNRIVMPSIETNLGTEDGHVTQRMKDYYEEHAKGGAGLITVEDVCTDYPTGQLTAQMLAIDDDKFILGLSELVQVIHRHNTKASVQIHHGGPRADYSISHVQPVGPSPVSVLGGVVPRELTTSEIEEIVTCYAKAVERAKRAGFDAVEIQFGGGYLLGAFLSGVTNKRQDAYGGELKNRARIHVEILKAVREAVGQSYPVLCRFNVREYGEQYGIAGCLTLEQSREFARMIENAGVSGISVLAYGFIQTRHGLIQDHFTLFPDEQGAYVPLAEEIKKVVSVPVITAGRLNPRLAEKILQEGKTDLVAIGRQLIADPHFPNKVASGRVEDIAPCIVCRTCIDRLFANQPLECSVNAALGREREYEIIPVEKRKKVLIVGGGPAGMEAARVAALRGHEVILCEKDHKLGGLLPIAALVKGIEVEDFTALVQYLKTQLKKLDVKVKLGKEVNLTVIDQIKPNVILLAAGGISVLPEIPGITNRNVVSAARIRSIAKFFLRFFGLRFLRWLTKFWMPLGKRVVIIGGSIIGLELAEFLVKRGRKVTILEESDELGAEMVMITKSRLVRWLVDRGVTMLTGVKYKEITRKGIIFTTKEGKRQTIEADSIMPAMFLKSNTELSKTVEGKVPEVYLIGDCKEPHLVRQAIADGYCIACAIEK